MFQASSLQFHLAGVLDQLRQLESTQAAHDAAFQARRLAAHGHGHHLHDALVRGCPCGQGFSWIELVAAAAGRVHLRQAFHGKNARLLAQ